MKKAMPTFEITIATDVAQNMIYFREGNGPWDKTRISDLPAPLMQLLIALDQGKRVKIQLAEVEYEKTI